MELDGHLKIKFSEEVAKISIPGKKNIYRIYVAS